MTSPNAQRTVIRILIVFVAILGALLAAGWFCAGWALLYALGIPSAWAGIIWLVTNALVGAIALVLVFEKRR